MKPNGILGYQSKCKSIKNNVKAAALNQLFKFYFLTEKNNILTQISAVYLSSILAGTMNFSLIYPKVSNTLELRSRSQFTEREADAIK